LHVAVHTSGGYRLAVADGSITKMTCLFVQMVEK